MENASLLKRWLAFASVSFMFWFFVFVAAPALVNTLPEMKQMADFVDFTGIETGEFYYTDVEIVGHASANARGTIEYLPKGPGKLAY